MRPTEVPNAVPIADSPERASVCDAIVRAPAGWLDLDSVVRRSSLDRETALDTLAELHLSGWIELEEREGHDAPVLSLTPLGADSLGVVVYSRGEAFGWRAASSPAKRDRVRRQSHVTGFPSDDFESRIADEQPSPLEALVIAERPMPPDPYPHLNAPGEPPHPGVILGLRLPWPAAWAPGEVCPGCGSAHLPPSHYCAICHAWGREMPPLPKPKVEENRVRHTPTPFDAERPSAAQEAAA